MRQPTQRQRDTYRKHAYMAQAGFFKHEFRGSKHYHGFTSLRLAQEWVDVVLGSVNQLLPPGVVPARVTLKLLRSDAKRTVAAACCTRDGWVIKVRRGKDPGSCAVSNLTLLHELAHTIQTAGPSHGGQWATLWLALVYQYIGRSSAERLFAYMHYQGLRQVPIGRDWRCVVCDWRNTGAG